MKARSANEVTRFEDIPNVGPRIARDFETLGVRTPHELAQKDPMMMYAHLCEVTKTRHDPCALDTFMAVVDFMQGAPRRPWYAYTQKRKKLYPNI